MRWCLLKLADLLIRGAEEAPPKVMIHLPPTPVAELAPQLPPVKVLPKARQTLKSGGPPVKSPLATFTVPPKLKIPLGGSLPDGSSRTPSSAIPLAERVTVSKVPAPKRSHPSDKKKPQNVPKAQSSGMSLKDLTACRNALTKLQRDKHATVFLQPVDPIRDRAPK